MINVLNNNAIHNRVISLSTVAYAGKNLGGFKVMAGIVGFPGAGEFSKTFLKKIGKMHFSLFFKKFNNLALNFREFGRKTNWLGEFREILKCFYEN